MPKILLVKKEEFLKKIYSDILRLRGYAVETTSGVSDALRKVEDFNPDLIIFDLAVSDMRCTDFLKAINHSRGGKTIPVLLLSSSPNIEVKDIGECLKLGAIGYMGKIGHPKEVVEKIEMILQPVFSAGSNSGLTGKSLGV